MICRKCGAYLEEGELFCPNCGTRAELPQAQPAQRTAPDPRYTQEAPRADYGCPQGGYAPAYQPEVNKAEPSAGESFFGKVWKAFKSFFTGHVMDGLRDEAKSKSLEWLLFLGAFITVFAISLPILIRQLVGSPASRMISYGAFFAAGLFTAITLIAWIFLFMLLHVKVIMKRRDVSPVSLLNVIAYASIPVTCALTVGMIFGVVHGLVSMMLIGAASLMAVILIYTAVKEWGSSENRDFFLFIAFTLAVMFMMLLFELLMALIIGAVTAIGSLSMFNYRW